MVLITIKMINTEFCQQRGKVWRYFSREKHHTCKKFYQYNFPPFFCQVKKIPVDPGMTNKIGIRMGLVDLMKFLLKRQLFYLPLDHRT